MKIAFISSWKTACGIATYTEKFKKEYEKLGHTVTVIDKLDPISVIEGCLREKPDIVHIQHEFGLFQNIPNFISLCGKLKQLGFKVFVTLHTEMDEFLWGLDGLVDGILLHNDSFDYTKYKLLSKFKRIAHPCPVFEELKPIRTELGIPEDSFVIGTCGFIAEGKKIDGILKGLGEFLRENNNVFVHLATTQHKNDNGYAKNVWLKNIQLLAMQHQFHDRLLINLNFLSFEELYRRIQTFDLAFVYAPPDAKSNSGVLTDLVGNGVPCVVNESIHFSHIDVGKYVCDNVPEGIQQLYYDRDLYTTTKNSIKDLFTFEQSAEIILNWYQEERN